MSRPEPASPARAAAAAIAASPMSRTISSIRRRRRRMAHNRSIGNPSHGSSRAGNGPPRPEPEGLHGRRRRNPAPETWLLGAGAQGLLGIGAQALQGLPGLVIVLVGRGLVPAAGGAQVAWRPVAALMGLGEGELAIGAAAFRRLAKPAHGLDGVSLDAKAIGI